MFSDSFAEWPSHVCLLLSVDHVDIFPILPPHIKNHSKFVFPFPWKQSKKKRDGPNAKFDMHHNLIDKQNWKLCQRTNKRKARKIDRYTYIDMQPLCYSCPSAHACMLATLARRPGRSYLWHEATLEIIWSSSCQLAITLVYFWLAFSQTNWSRVCTDTVNIMHPLMV